MYAILQAVYSILTDGAMIGNALNAGIDLIYKPRGNRFVILTDQGEFYQVEIVRISQSAFIEFRKEKED